MTVPARRPEDPVLDALDRLTRLADRAPERTVYAREKDMQAADTIREALERLREERDDLRDEYMADAGLRTAAEAEVRRLTAIIRAHWSPEQADALLADSPSDGGGV